MKNKKFVSIKTRLIIFFLLLVFIMTAVSSFVYINSYNTSKKFVVLINNLFILNNLSDSINNVQKNLEDYLNLKTAETFNRYINSYDNLLFDINNLPIDINSNEEYTAFSNIKGMIVTYDEEANNAIKASRGRDAEKTLVYMNETRKVSIFMGEQIRYLLLNHISRNEIIFNTLTVKMNQIQTIIIFFIFAIAILTFLFAIVFSSGITKPITNLINSAKRVSNGDFELTDVKTIENDEIGILSNAFNIMARNIKELINEIKEKSNVERKLQKKELENLKIVNLLKETELKALQSQINPHFLFNTLSCINHTAMIEGADSTCDLLEAVSEILKYNLTRIDKDVSLLDEINNLKSYVIIQKARYRDRVKFKLCVEDDDILSLSIPCLTIQPIVENAFMHGIEKCEKPGNVFVKIFKSNTRAIIEIFDTGVGMSEKKIQDILTDTENNKTDVSGHTTGIGIKNVIRRLKIFYCIDDVIDITSSKNNWTKISLKIPLERSKIKNV